MSITRIPATLVAPSLGALAHGAAAVVRPSAFRDRLERELHTLYPHSHPLPFASGRAALAQAMIVAMRATGRRVVVLPAYTAPSVAAAAAMAGARVRLCDIDPETLDLDREHLLECIDEQTAAVVVGNLYGYPSATADLCRIRERGVVLIDDAAQALGARDGGEPVGGRGDLGVVSFGRDKCVSTGGGGALLVHNDALRSCLADARSRAAGRGVSELAVAAGAKLLWSLAVLGIARRPAGAPGAAASFRPRFAMRPAAASVNGLASDLPTAVWYQREARTVAAQLWAAALADCAAVRAVLPRRETQPAYLRFPVIASDGETRRRLAERLSGHGVHYAHSYSTTLGRIDGFGGWCEGPSAPKAEALAERLLVLPCHAGVSPRLVRRVARTLRAVPHSPRRSPAFTGALAEG